MAQISTRTRRPAQEYRVAHVMVANITTSERVTVPNLIYTVAGIQGLIDDRESSLTVDLICEACGESVADCLELKGQVTTPREWSWESKVDQD